jgi:acyl-CoA thioester hydrolase
MSSGHETTTMRQTVTPSISNLREVSRYRVLFADCDPMRVMYYGNYFRLFEIGRAELFRQLGHPFPDYIEQGLYLAVLATDCRYHRPARYDDDLVVRAGIADVGRVRLTIAYEIAAPDGTLLASGHTEHAVVNDAGHPRRLPAEFRRAAESSAVQN